ncbi:hypothetical protein OY671_008688, partial [Metschnikowia pulcherrima]
DAVDLVSHDSLFRQLPVPFIIDHMGRVPTRGGSEQEPFRHLVNSARSNPHCWVKISGAERISSDGPPFTDAVPFAQASIAAAPDRISWGTDWPHPNMDTEIPDDGHSVDMIPRIAPTEELQRKSSIDNPTALYWAD